MNNIPLNKLNNNLDYHRNNEKGFLFQLFKYNYFSKVEFYNLIQTINEIKVIFKGNEKIPRNIGSILFEINYMVQVVLGDISEKKYFINISESELFDYWEELKFAILDFFDDVYRN